MHIFKALTDAIDLRIEDLTEFLADGLPNDDDDQKALDLLIAERSTIQDALSYYLYAKHLEDDGLTIPEGPEEFKNDWSRGGYFCSECGIYDNEEVTGCTAQDPCGAYCGEHGCDCEGSTTNPEWLEKQ